MPIEHLVIYCIAVWRVANLFVNEMGPWNIFKWVRERVGIAHDSDGFPYLIPETFFAQALSCIWCFSVWVALFFTLLWISAPELSLQLAVFFAFTGGAILIDTLMKFLKKGA